MGRRTGRKKAMQTLFQIDLGGNDPEKAIKYTFKQNNSADDFGSSLVLGTLKHQQEIDQLIAAKTPDWDLSRMASVERNVLRLAVYELIFASDAPARVVINEAIELAKIFSGEESGAFVNGVLDEIWKSYEGQKIE